MRLAINLILLIIVGGLIWLLIGSIREPIRFKAEKTKREKAVGEQLATIRTAQELYRGVTGEFADNFDTLATVLKSDSFQIIQVFGDPDDPTNLDAVIYDTIYKAAMDSVMALGINVDSLRYVPYGKGTNFRIAADTLTYQKTLVNVVEVGIPYTAFMGKWGDPRFAKYDDAYNPTKVLKFGDMNTPNLSGNWYWE